MVSAYSSSNDSLIQGENSVVVNGLRPLGSVYFRIPDSFCLHDARIVISGEPYLHMHTPFREIPRAEFRLTIFDHVLVPSGNVSLLQCGPFSAG